MGNSKKKLVSIRRKQYIHESSSNHVTPEDHGNQEDVQKTDHQEENIQTTSEIEKPSPDQQPTTVLDQKGSSSNNFNDDQAQEKEIPEMTEEEKQFLSTEKIAPDSVEDFNKEIRKMLVDRHNIYSSVRESFISRNTGVEKQEIHETGNIESAYDDRNYRVVSSSKRASKTPVNRRMSYLSSSRTL